MSTESIDQRVKKVIAEQLCVGEELLTPEAHMQDDLGADSLDAVEVIMGLEEEFNIVISDEAADKMLTVRDAIVYIEENV